MNRPSDPPDQLREKLIGLGERSFRKSYYPELQRRLTELERFRALLDSSNDAFLLLRAESGNIVDLNASICRRLGYLREELIGRNFLDIADLDALPAFTGETENGITPGENPAVDTVLHGKDDVSFDAEVTFNRHSFSDADYIIVVARDISEQRKTERILIDLAQGVSARTGEDFLRTLTEHLAKVLRADFALVGELLPERRETVRTIAVYGNNTFVDNFEYELKNTPCREVVNTGICSYCDRVANLFPEDRLLGELEIQAYVGAPLKDVDGAPLGVLVVLYRHPLKQPLIAENLLGIFASRAAAELERRRAQTALESSEKRFRTVFETTPDAIVIATRDGNIIDVNPGFTKQSGFSRAEVLGRNSGELGLWDEPELRERMRKKLEKHGIIHNLMADFRLKGGQVKTGLLSAQLMEIDNQSCMLVIIRDISEIVETQQALRDSERQLRTLVGNIPGAVYRCACDEHWTMAFISDAVAELTGYQARDFLDNNVRSFHSIIYPEDRQMVAAVIDESVSAHVPFAIDFRILHADGSVRWLYQRGQAIYDDTNRVRFLDGVLFDLTERKQAEETIRRFDKIKSEFISTAAHELRTPLTAIMGFTEFLLDPEKFGPFTAAQTEEFTREIYRKSEALEQIVNDMLDISRIEAGQGFTLNRELSDPATIIVDVANLMTRDAPRHRLVFDLEQTGARRCRIDVNRFIQVLENLMSNAIKYSPEGGTIRLTSRFTDDSWSFAIRDEGIGMTEEQVERVFDKFYRADSSDTAVGGLGLGMSIAQQIVLAHRGQIEVESEPGRGTTVRLQIPLDVETE